MPQPERVTSVGSVAEALHHIAGAMSDTQVMTVGESIVGWIGQSAGRLLMRRVIFRLLCGRCRGRSRM